MLTAENTADLVARSFSDLWVGVINFLPEIIVAIVIFIVGWIIAALLGRAVNQIIKAVKLDSALRGAGFERALSRAGFNLDSGRFIGELVKWFVVIVFLVN